MGFLREMGTLGMRRPQGLRCPIAERRGRPWAALGFTFPGVALPNRPLGKPTASMEPMGRHDDDLPKPEAFGIVSALSTGVLPPRPDILYPDSRACSALYTLHAAPSSLRPMLH